MLLETSFFLDICWLVSKYEMATAGWSYKKNLGGPQKTMKDSS